MMAISDFNTESKRARLAYSREPYWFKLSKGRFFGYRKGQNAGTWVARLGKKSGAIGDDGTMSYEDAMQEVIAWCDRQETGANRKYTVTDCVKGYYQYLALERTPQTASDTEARLSKHLTPELLARDVRKLTTKELTAWRNSMVPGGLDPEATRKRKDSANRVWSMLRAALNLAYKEGVIESDTAWKRVQSFKKVNKARTLFLTDKQVNDLLDNTSGAFTSLCKAAILTGARYGELAAAKVSDLKDDGTLFLDGKTGSRDCFLSCEAEAFFKQQAKGKLPQAPLLISHEGLHWKHGQQQPPMKNAVRAAKLPADTVFYSLRHFHISKAVLAGVSLLAIAKNCGTSTAMIEAHYGKFTPRDMRRLMDLVELGGVK
jgi:integrase